MNKIKMLFAKSKTSKFFLVLLVISVCIVISHDGFPSIKTEKNEAIFEDIYQKWRTRVRNHPEFALSSFIPYAEKIKEFDTIVELGIPILPLIFRKIEENEGVIIGPLIGIVNKICKISARDIVSEKFEIPATEAYRKWWNHGRLKTKERFIKQYSDWKQATSESKFKRGFIKEKLRPHKRTSYQQFLDLGVPALPLAIEKIREGDSDLIAAINYWTDDALQKSADKEGVATDKMSAYCLKWWEANKENWLLPPIEKQVKE